MKNTKFLKVGEKRFVNDDVRYKPHVYDDGLVFGNIFKDEEAYINNWDDVCYIPESTWNDLICDEVGFYSDVNGYTHNDLLLMCNHNRSWCDDLFHRLSWAMPETYLNEDDDVEDAYFYQFIKQGAKVWRHALIEENSGVYDVVEVPFKFDEKGLLINPRNFSLGMSISIAKEFSIINVPLTELTPVYADLIEKTNK